MKDTKKSIELIIDSNLHIQNEAIRENVIRILKMRLITASDKIRDFCVQLEKWNKTINLISPRDINEMMSKHIIDSAVAASIIWIKFGEDRASSNIEWVDIGSGAGFPGIIISLMFPESKIYLCEPKTKKSHFLQEVRTNLSLENVHISNLRIEQFEKPKESELINSSRIAKTKTSIATTRATGMTNMALEIISKKLPELLCFAEITAPITYKDNKKIQRPLFSETYYIENENQLRCVNMYTV